MSGMNAKPHSRQRPKLPPYILPTSPSKAENLQSPSKPRKQGRSSLSLSSSKIPPPNPSANAKITVRPALPTDISSFPEMKVRTWNETYSAYGVPQWYLDEPPDVEGFRSHYPTRISDPARNTWVAFDEDAGIVIGYATADARANREGYVEIRAVYVLAEYQGRGFGERLVNGVVGVDSKCRAVLETLVVNLGARRFYERLGFTRLVGVQPGNMGGVDLPNVVLARDAGGPETTLELIRA